MDLQKQIEKEKELIGKIREVEHVLTAKKTSVMDQIRINVILDLIHELYPKAIFDRVYSPGCPQCLLDLQKSLPPLYERLQMTYSDDQEVADLVVETVEPEKPKTRGRKRKN